MSHGSKGRKGKGSGRLPVIEGTPLRKEVTDDELRHIGQHAHVAEHVGSTFFLRASRGETIWRRLTAPALAAFLLGGIVVLAVGNYATLLGVPSSSPAAWALPASYAVVAAGGIAWGIALKTRRPERYATVGLGADAITARLRLAEGRGGQYR